MTPLEEAIREELESRRQRLLTLVTSVKEAELVELLRRVDSALERLAVGEWSRCAVCHGALEADRLLADPLIAVCLDCLTAEERTSLQRDLQAAAQVQAALLPPGEFRHDGWEVALRWEPHGPVSGDHCDLLRPLREADGLHVVLGDVSGKGVAASLVQSHLHALLRALASPEVPLAELFARANRLLCEATLPATYVTLVVARLRSGGRVTLVNAGHPPPLLADRRGVRPVEGAELPLGLFCEAEYRERELELQPGDTLLLYTDGWTEAASAAGEYGVGRAAAALRRAAGRPLPELLAACREDVRAFLADASPGDDLTLLALRRVE